MERRKSDEHFSTPEREFQVFNAPEAVSKTTFRRVNCISVSGTPLQGAVFPAPAFNKS